jgi:hypothetical protein
VSDTPDAGDWLVSQVAARVGGLTADEHAAVYGAGYSYATSSTAPMHADTAAWIATILQDFRTRGCPYCHHGLLEHTLAVSELGPAVICDADNVSRPAWQWHAGPQPVPVWRVLLAVILWIGIPLTTVGLASWLMPLIAAVTRRQRRWALGAVGWGALTLLLIVVIERGADGPALGWLALVLWFGSALYGGLQVKPWLSESTTPRPARAQG